MTAHLTKLVMAHTWTCELSGEERQLLRAAVAESTDDELHELFHQWTRECKMAPPMEGGWGPYCTHQLPF